MAGSDVCHSENNLVTTQPAPELAKQVILIVDDDDAVRKSLRSLMESAGFAVRAFSNGHDLLNEASLPAIGCLVVDYHMPAMNGLELVSALRGRGVSIPAILITGNPTKYVRDRAAAIAVLVVEKPRLGSYLLDCVRDAVAKHAQSLS
jgi:two-component system, LuxR family, response regulator FixJ